MTRHFVALGMTTIGHFARTPLAVLKSKFRARFGKQSDIRDEVMWRTANGLDDSPPKFVEGLPKYFYIFCRLDM